MDTTTEQLKEKFTHGKDPLTENELRNLMGGLLGGDVECGRQVCAVVVIQASLTHPAASVRLRACEALLDNPLKLIRLEFKATLEALAMDGTYSQVQFAAEELLARIREQQANA